MEQLKDQGLVKIDWVDSRGVTNRWETVDTFDQENAKVCDCTSIGYLVYQDKDVFMIAPHVAWGPEGEIDQLVGVMTIAKRSVIRITDLE